MKSRVTIGRGAARDERTTTTTTTRTTPERLRPFRTIMPLIRMADFVPDPFFFLGFWFWFTHGKPSNFKSASGTLRAYLPHRNATTPLLSTGSEFSVRDASTVESSGAFSFFGRKLIADCVRLKHRQKNGAGFYFNSSTKRFVRGKLHQVLINTE